MVGRLYDLGLIIDLLRWFILINLIPVYIVGALMELLAGWLHHVLWSTIVWLIEIWRTMRGTSRITRFTRHAIELLCYKFWLKSSLTHLLLFSHHFCLLELSLSISFKFVKTIDQTFNLLLWNVLVYQIAIRQLGSTTRLTIVATSSSFSFILLLCWWDTIWKTAVISIHWSTYIWVILLDSIKNIEICHVQLTDSRYIDVTLTVSFEIKCWNFWIFTAMRLPTTQDGLKAKSIVLTVSLVYTGVGVQILHDLIDLVFAIVNWILSIIAPVSWLLILSSSKRPICKSFMVFQIWLAVIMVCLGLDLGVQLVISLIYIIQQPLCHHLVSLIVIITIFVTLRWVWLSIETINMGIICKTPTRITSRGWLDDF